MVIEPAFCGARLVKSTSVGVRERASKAPNLCEAFLLCCSYYLPVHCSATAAYEGTSVKLGAVYGGRVAAQHQQSSSGKIQAADNSLQESKFTLQARCVTLALPSADQMRPSLFLACSRGANPLSSLGVELSSARAYRPSRGYLSTQ